jgi:hypothetical protein
MRSPLMVRVESSSIRSIGYDATTATLVVEFHDGDRYAYDGAPARAHHDLVTAESIGAHFNREVRNAYACRRL